MIIQITNNDEMKFKTLQVMTKQITSNDGKLNRIAQPVGETKI